MLRLAMLVLALSVLGCQSDGLEPLEDAAAAETPDSPAEPVPDDPELPEYRPWDENEGEP